MIDDVLLFLSGNVDCGPVRERCRGSNAQD